MDEISIVLSGEAGSGLKTVEEMVTKILAKDGYNVYSFKEIMSRVRGGNNTTQIRVSETYTGSYTEKTDFLFVFDPGSLYRLEDRIQENTVILGPKSFFSEDEYKKYKIKEIEFIRIASEIGNPIFSNTVIMGTILGMFAVEKNNVYDILRKKFVSKGEEVILNNIKAFESGYAIGEEYKITMKKASPKKHISGNEAVTYGAIAGGMNFIAAYPMSPGTDVVMLAAQLAEKYDIIVEQAEDEIAAVNMVLGAWYAGARAMTSTSGGGFALMEEGISMSGIGEIPLVVHNAMRPGPGTGLPTRTEQGDLNLAMYAGHGDFPRVLLAPNTLESGIELGQKAFNIADKYQIPVILLTDAHFLSQTMNLENEKVNLEENTYYIEKSDPDYKKYKITESGISPRSVPGYGKGLVKVDSDEHTEEGLITEDFNVRINMTDKRMKKLNTYVDVEPDFLGNENYKTLIIGWGSTYGAIKEALSKINNPDIAFLSFTQVFPVPKSAKKYLDKAENIILIENNVTGHFGTLLESTFRINFQKKILKYNGLPFNIEELIREIGG